MTPTTPTSSQPVPPAAGRPERRAAGRPECLPAAPSECPAAERSECPAGGRPERASVERPEPPVADRSERLPAEQPGSLAAGRPERRAAGRPECLPAAPSECPAAERSECPAGGRPEPHVLFVRFHPGAGGVLDEPAYGGALDLLGEITPVVQAVPPDAALADVRGALRYFGRGAGDLAALLRVRVLARYGVDCTIGVAANPSLARLAAREGPRGAVRVLPAEPAAVTDFLADQPVTALPGIGPATARLLGSFGLDSVGRVAAAPLGTLQRLLGAGPGRRLRDQALGIDPVPVTPNAPARSLGAERRFDRDELDPARQRRALLALADELGVRLRSGGQVARSLTLTVRYADGAATVRTRPLPEPTGHTAALADTAYRMHAALGLQRARLRAVALRAEGLGPADRAAHQLSFDPEEERARRIERITDLARERFGFGVIMPAALLGVA